METLFDLTAERSPNPGAYFLSPAEIEDERRRAAARICTGCRYAEECKRFGMYGSEEAFRCQDERDAGTSARVN